MARVELEGLVNEESVWDPICRVFAYAPNVLREELRKNRLEAKLKSAERVIRGAAYIVGNLSSRLNCCVCVYLILS